MLDVTRILHPDNGVVTASNVLVLSEGPSRFFSVGAMLSCLHSSDQLDDPLPSCQTGACSTARTQASIRTAGEAVERLALHPASALPSGLAAGTLPRISGRFDELGDRALRFFDEDLSLGADPADRILDWHPGRRIRTDSEILVPAGLIDYPLSGEKARGFDPGPSGTAAGTSASSALKSALLEVIERDAVIVAWARQLRTRAVDIEDLLAEAGRDAHWSRLRTTLDRIRAAGHTPVFAEVPTSVSGVVCVVGGFTGDLDGTPFTCLGAKASDHPGAALLGACEESLQLWFGLRSGRLSGAAPEVVATDLDRVRFLSSEIGQQAVAGWLADSLPATLTAAATELSVEALLDSVIADGLDPIVVDLTPRLPATVAAQGWYVIKVIGAGYQPLRIDERNPFGWNPGRLADAAERTGSDSRLADCENFGHPHPLP